VLLQLDLGLHCKGRKAAFYTGGLSYQDTYCIYSFTEHLNCACHGQQ